MGAGSWGAEEKRILSSFHPSTEPDVGLHLTALDHDLSQSQGSDTQPAESPRCTASALKWEFSFCFLSGGPADQSTLPSSREPALEAHSHKACESPSLCRSRLLLGFHLLVLILESRRSAVLALCTVLCFHFIETFISYSSVGLSFQSSPFYILLSSVCSWNRGSKCVSTVTFFFFMWLLCPAWGSDSQPWGQESPALPAEPAGHPTPLHHLDLSKIYFIML